MNDSGNEQSACLSSERQRIISEKVRKEGQVFIAQLASEFSVSVETIRRDINYLNKINSIRKVHGGAVAVNKNLHEEGYAQRVDIDREEKEKIGLYTSRFVKDNDVVAFDSGVTLDWLAQYIDGVKNITIIINSISALNILLNKHNNGDFTGKIIFLGGEVNCRNHYTLGGLTTDMLKNFSVDKAFIASTSISLNGVRMYDVNDGLFSSMLVKQAAVSYLLAASSKFGKESLYKVCDFNNIQHIITDNRNTIPTNLEKTICNAGVQLHIVEV